ncbi:MAG TPA: hypothetical protein VHA54_10810 [Solirubrobacterales bacterium]|nr:hypothetical protein [Solirubrobacterales bacterium]
MFLAALAAALTIALAAVAGPAAAANSGFETARFKVEVEGSSTTTWKSELEADSECDTSDHSYGRERFTFATKKPFVIVATPMPGEVNPLIFAGHSALGVPVEARVQRSYTPVVSPPARVCGDNGGGAEPVRPDCGSRRIPNWHVQIEFSDEKRNGLQLHGDSSVKVPYEHCVGTLYNFPFLLDTVNPRTDEPLFADLSPDDLFNPGLQKWITIGDGEFKNDDPSLKSRTHVHWTVSFTRLKGR